MAKQKNKKHISKNKLILIIAWIVSLLILVLCSIVIMTYNVAIPLKTKIILFFSVQIASGFFFPITIGKIIQVIRDRDIATIIWDFVSDYGHAGLIRFYSSRDDDNAKDDLKNKFDEHKKGDILLIGPSLRLFLAPDTYFRKVIEYNLQKYEEAGVNIRIVNNDIKDNTSLPIRSYVEEFNPDGTHPEGESRTKFSWQTEAFDWNSNINSESDSLNLEKFCSEFYKKYGREARSPCRVICDLGNVKRGIDELNSKTGIGCLIQARSSCYAPYFTAVIFPDICYYTPNILYPNPPVNMPMLAFLRGGPVYEKIITHFRFIWWSGIKI